MAGYELGRLGRAVDLDRSLLDAGRPVLEGLAERCRETVTLALPRPGPTLEIVAQIDAPHVVRVQDWVGGPLPLHATANGKLLLADLSADELDAALRVPRRRLAASTIVDARVLRRELGLVRERGWATIVDELEDGLAAVATGARDAGGRLAAIVSVTGPAPRFDAAARDRAVVVMMEKVPGLLTAG